MLLIKRGNKRGWIRIVEAFIAVLLIAGVLLIVINRGYIGRSDVSEQVYKVQLSVLREIELDDDLRSKVLEVGENQLPVNWTSFNNTKYRLGDVKQRIIDRTPEYLTCEARICKLDVICAQEKFIEHDVYAQSVAITADLERYAPRQLKLFCWTAA
jgi:hypothetical protein